MKVFQVSGIEVGGLGWAAVGALDSVPVPEPGITIACSGDMVPVGAAIEGDKVGVWAGVDIVEDVGTTG